jgi:hypothetical protein
MSALSLSQCGSAIGKPGYVGEPKLAERATVSWPRIHAQKCRMWPGWNEPRVFRTEQLSTKLGAVSPRIFVRRHQCLLALPARVEEGRK